VGFEPPWPPKSSRLIIGSTGVVIQNPDEDLGQALHVEYVSNRVVIEFGLLPCGKPSAVEAHFLTLPPYFAHCDAEELIGRL
jgi:hypothetical protein